MIPMLSKFLRCAIGLRKTSITKWSVEAWSTFAIIGFPIIMVVLHSNGCSTRFRIPMKNNARRANWILIWRKRQHLRASFRRRRKSSKHEAWRVELWKGFILVGSLFFIFNNFIEETTCEGTHLQLSHFYYISALVANCSVKTYQKQEDTRCSIPVLSKIERQACGSTKDGALIVEELMIFPLCCSRFFGFQMLGACGEAQAEEC